MSVSDSEKVVKQSSATEKNYESGPCMVGGCGISRSAFRLKLGLKFYEYAAPLSV